MTDVSGSARDPPPSDPVLVSNASPDGLPPLRDVISAHALQADRRLGQNFILDLNLTRRIARAAGPLAGMTSFEVGPGPGGLTRALFLEGAARVVAIERDRRCLPALAAIAAKYENRLDIQADDALKMDWRHLANGVPHAVIVANLPYNIATILLVGWLETEPWPPWYARMVLMFQKEVAERIVAAPGTKAYGRLSVLSQWRTQPRLLFVIPPAAFTPAPKVESAVVLFTPRPSPSPECSVTTLGRVTAAAFGQRRKMLRSSLKQLLPDPMPLLEAAGLAGTRRAEELHVADFAHLARIFERWPVARDV